MRTMEAWPNDSLNLRNLKLELSESYYRDEWLVTPPPIHEISKIILNVVIFDFRLSIPLILHLSSHFTKSN